MNLCKECNKRKVDIKIRKLCITCATMLKRNGELEKVKNGHKRSQRIKYLIKKYGKQFVRDMRTMHTEYIYSPSELGRRYNVSRQYISQVYQLIYKDKTKCIRDEWKKKVNQDISGSCLHNPKVKIAEWKEGSLLYKGANAEAQFVEKCENLGFDIKIPDKRGIGVWVNEYLVAIKTCLKAKKYAEKSHRTYLRYQLSKINRETCHFFSLYDAAKDEFYILPNLEIGIQVENVKCIFIPYDRVNTKYNKYKNAFMALSRK